MTFQKHEIDLVVKATEKLLKDLSKRITVADLQKLVYMDQHKLQEIFKVAFGTTISDYFLFHKMLIATRELKESNRPIKEIAASLGYYAQNFSAAFKKYIGCTPADYRKGIMIQRKWNNDRESA